MKLCRNDYRILHIRRKGKYVNQLLRYITEQGWGQLLYNVFFVAGFVAVFLYAMVNGKKYGIPKGKALLYIIIVYFVSLLWMFFQCWVENGFKGWGGNNIVRTFVWVPLAAWPAGKLLKVDWVRGCDFVAPCVPLVQGVAHWGCIFAGCCHGYACSWGIYNPLLNQNVFPCPPAEALTALIVVFIVCGYEKRQNYKPNGLAYPLMLMLFGYSRFLLEFLRDNRKVVFGVSTLALHALFMALVGTAVYVTIKEREKTKPMKTGRK